MPTKRRYDPEKQREYSRRSRERHRAEYNARQRARRAKNREQALAYERQWRKDHPRTEKDRKWAREHYRKNRERMLAWQRQYRKDHPESARRWYLRQKEWRHKNRQYVNAYNRAWQKAHPGYDSDRHLKRKFGITRAQWGAIFEAQGRKCAICGSTTPRSKWGWHTDHDHVSGKVRGILCWPCNHKLSAVELLGPQLNGYLRKYGSANRNVSAPRE